MLTIFHIFTVYILYILHIICSHVAGGNQKMFVARGNQKMLTSIYLQFQKFILETILFHGLIVYSEDLKFPCLSIEVLYQNRGIYFLQVWRKQNININIFLSELKKNCRNDQIPWSFSYGTIFCSDRKQIQIISKLKIFES